MYAQAPSILMEEQRSPELSAECASSSSVKDVDTFKDAKLLQKESEEWDMEMNFTKETAEDREFIASFGLDPDAASEPGEWNVGSQHATEQAKSDSAWSDIPVVQASSSKILVDAMTQWRCFIASESPQEESERLRALRQSLEEDLKATPSCKELVGDVRLLRFLRGCKLNVSEAALKYREMLQLRKTHQLDPIRSRIIDENLHPEQFPHYDKVVSNVPFAHSFDACEAVDSSPMEINVFSFELTGFIDLKGLEMSVSNDEWMEFLAYELEYRSIQLDRLSREKECLVQTVFVKDLGGFSFLRGYPTRILTLFRNSIALATACYPETIRVTLFLNAPWLFHRLWRSLSPYLQQTQLNKIDMRGSETYESLLQMLGGRDQLPTLMGGKSTSISIPRTGLLAGDSYALLCEHGAVEVDISARKSLQIPFRTLLNDTVCWEFLVQNLDVDFEVRLRTQGEQGGASEWAILTRTRVPHGEQVTGEYRATEDATIVLVWDNSYSWARSKRIAYKAKVVRATHDFSRLDTSV
uniref:Uncharacterized protein AlNc14C39G3369 n=1 Tax=Albugo laibachii Nc14 TaxID=890382 RepID=F0W9A2_9STRA|nr:conserved hypothetical protein [Albugo laibachii Nc14]CCA18361.1 conserved hypothetical protein [Albugo laibachii Nc14]|eukprot:CCA18361.1 conserved hypothetical protein [Albugo laibachii Nc14]